MDSSQGSNTTPGSSAWGGFLKKAMEGVEQQLDRVLENPPSKVREAGNVAKREVTPVQSKPTSSSGLGRMTLQERLAASIAKSRTGSPKTPGEEGSTVVTPARSSGDTSRIESNGTIKENILSSPIRIETPNLPASPIQSQTPITELKDIPSRTETPDIQVIPGEYTTTEPEVSNAHPEAPKADPATIAPPSETRISTEPSPTRTSSISLTTSIPTDTDPATVDLVSQLRNDLATCEARRVEESQQASERISSLEEKLKTLLETTVNASRELASNPNAESWERKTAEREEKIALLLDEGEKLAKIELTLMTTIKSLRAKQKEDASITTSAVSRAEKTEKQLADVKAQLKKANEIEKKNTERLKGMYKTEATNEALKREREAAQATIAMLQTALAEAVSRADEAVSQIQTEALEQERLANTELRENLERVKSEYSASEARLNSEIAELKGQLEREQLTAKTVQGDLTAEINTLESKLEVLRSRVEESSTSANSSAQAKLLRQIDMLQTQHTIASQNWQRIEGSLQNRTETLEQEKLDIIQRWEDEKRKVKDAAEAKRIIQSQLDDLKHEMRDLQTELLKSQSQVQSLQDSITSLETRLAEQAAAFTKEKESLQESFETSLDTRLKEEKQKWEEDQQILFAAPPLSAGYPQFPTPMSPRQPQRAFKSVSPQPEIATKPRGTFPPSRTTSYGDIPHLRRPSRPFASPFDVLSPASTPSIHIPHHTLEDEDERDFLSPSRGDSPKNTVADAVSVSASTTTAGPSVNIMERMSAAVRRLESDLAATKEEMARSIKQRDEAREECVKLMSEVEEKRRFQQAVRDTQTKYDDLENRYNEALLLLGEKSERVEELQMDIVDLKEGYQHALQRLVGGK